MQDKGGIYMSVKQIGVTVGGNIKRFTALDTDPLPTTNIGAGSTAIITNDATSKVVSTQFFNGTKWNGV
jgi:hypothetical protein